jgi:hypothetical protein
MCLIMNKIFISEKSPTFVFPTLLCISKTRQNVETHFVFIQAYLDENLAYTI